MVPPRFLPILLLAAACSGAAPRGPASPAAVGDPAAADAVPAPGDVQPETRPTRVTLKDHRTGATLGLLNQRMTSESEFYSKLRKNPTYKVIPDLEMGALMRQLQAFGYFGSARRSADRVPGARVTVQVERGGVVSTLAWASGDGADRIKMVQDCSLAVRTLYNVHHAFQVVENPQGEGFFDSERARLGKKPEKP